MVCRSLLPKSTGCRALYRDPEQTTLLITPINRAVFCVNHGCVDLNLWMDSVVVESFWANSTNCSSVFSVWGLT